MLTAVMRRRFETAIAMTMKLARMDLDRNTKMRTTHTKILPHALYGVEHSNPPEGLLNKLATAIMRAIGTIDGRKDIDLIFQASQLGDKDLDPTVQITNQRVMGLRRATAMRGDIEDKVGKIIE